MDEIVQRPVNELAREIERLGEAAWPARETAVVQGWLLRFSDGYSSRANSVSTLAFEGELSQAIAAVELAYRSRGLVPQFQVSPASRPLELEQELIARGYRHRTPSLLMCASTVALATTVAEAEISTTAGPDFVHLTLQGSHSPADGSERLATLARITLSKAYLVLRASDEAIACGASVISGAWASVYVMRTAEKHRRHGHGGSILAAIAKWAHQRGATQLYLQVDETNRAARALYQRAGFRDAYR